MPLHPAFWDIFFRLALAFLAALAIGFNREERNEAAGLRTTILVCLAACIAAVASNLLLDTTGKNPGFFTQIDALRLPLGILSGIGFIGAGAIIKKDDIALGVTTAATMWFMTVIGLCFGLGFLALGLAGSLVGLVVIWGLKWLDSRMPKAMRATLIVEADTQILDERSIHQLVRERYKLIAWSSEYQAGGRVAVKAVLQWSGRAADAAEIPALVAELNCRPGVLSVVWRPAAITG
jgi:putative Mg2+ transporter-C (MgtC) family protein